MEGLASSLALLSILSLPHTFCNELRLKSKTVSHDNHVSANCSFYPTLGVIKHLDDIYEHAPESTRKKIKPLRIVTCVSKGDPKAAVAMKQPLSLSLLSDDDSKMPIPLGSTMTPFSVWSISPYPPSLSSIVGFEVQRYEKLL